MGQRCQQFVLLVVAILGFLKPLDLLSRLFLAPGPRRERALERRVCLRHFHRPFMHAAFQLGVGMQENHLGLFARGHFPLQLDEAACGILAPLDEQKHDDGNGDEGKPDQEAVPAYPKATFGKAG